MPAFTSHLFSGNEYFHFGMLSLFSTELGVGWFSLTAAAGSVTDGERERERERRGEHVKVMCRCEDVKMIRL